MERVKSYAPIIKLIEEARSAGKETHTIDAIEAEMKADDAFDQWEQDNWECQVTAELNRILGRGDW